MCLLTVFPDKVQPDTELLLNGAYLNDDGHGYAIADTDSQTLIIGKGMDKNAVVTEFAGMRARYPNGPALFHSRFATHGVKTVDNCHPFYVGGDSKTLVGHNGILPVSVQPDKTDNRSDTRIFAEDFYPTLKETAMDTEKGQKSLESWMGQNNKIAILTLNPIYKKNLYIFNESLGTWEDGIWYSNSGYCGYRYTTGTTYSSSSYTGSSYKYEQFDASQQCPTCMSLGTIDRMLRYCEWCNCCLDCEEYYEQCNCYVYSSSMHNWDITAKTDTSDNGLEVANLIRRWRKDDILQKARMFDNRSKVN